MREYQAFYSDHVAEFILELPKRRQGQLVSICAQIARNPFLRSDYKIKDMDGREIDHLSTEGFVIAYWIDHPVSKVMIVDVEDLR